MGTRPMNVRKKLLGKCDSDDSDCDEDDSVLLLREKRLKNLVANTKECDCGGRAELKVRKKQSEVFLTLQCSLCENVLYEDEPDVATLEKKTGKILTSMNIRLVYASMVNDTGHAGLTRLCSVLGTPRMSTGTYHKYKDEICGAINEKYKTLRVQMC